MKNPDHTIVKTETTAYSVAITLQNGVVLYVSANKDCFHLSFAGAEIPMSVSSCANSNAPKIQTSNVLDIEYKPIAD